MDFGVTIIGAGVDGLAVASEVDGKRSTLVLEKNGSFGLETSSRNNGVRHSGIYYLPGSNKARFCVEGGRLLDEMALNHNIPHKKCGKFVVAVDDSEVPKLEDLLRTGEANGVEGLKILSGEELKAAEPYIKGVAALHCPSVGIMDQMALMSYFMRKARDKGATFAYNTKVTGIEKMSDGFRVTIAENNGEPDTFTTRVLVNCAGLFADEVAAMAGIDIDAAGYRQIFNKGSHYNVVNPEKRKLVNGFLIYPVPPETGLGIHITRTLDGEMRLGPDSQIVTRDEMIRMGYRSDDGSKRDAFWRDAQKYFPSLEPGDIVPGMVGYRTQVAGHDFIICEESARGLPGLVNCIGIESPGLTASPAIARYVRSLVDSLI